MTQICEVQFKGVRTDYYTHRGDRPVRDREYVIVQADRGRDLGVVKRWVDAESHTCDGGCTHAEDHPVVPPQKRILRRAAPVDVERLFELREEEPGVCRKTRELVEEHGLNMKVSDAEWQWDKKKLTVFFTADRRVDFRSLVKDMAGAFRTRIELRQIGVRDEARRLGGIGRCGRELCCRTWLKDLEPVTLQLAKDQGLSLNPAQISGACGRLMNCLQYEHDSYVQANKRYPKKGQTLTTDRGTEEVVSWNHFQETVTLRDETGETRVVSREQLREETSAHRGPPAPVENGGGGDGGDDGDDD